MSRRRPRSAVRAALSALLLVPALFLISPTAAMACSCAGVDTKTLLGYVDTVAAGELTEIAPPPPQSGSNVDVPDHLTYTVTVQTVFKGEPGDPLVFQSSPFGASCGLENMRVGDDYVFFVRDGTSGLCDGTSPATPQLIADVEAVTGPGQPVTAPEPTTAPEAAPETEHESGAPPFLWPALAAAVVVLMALGWLVWCRPTD